MSSFASSSLAVLMNTAFMICPILQGCIRVTSWNRSVCVGGLGGGVADACQGMWVLFPTGFL